MVQMAAPRARSASSRLEGEVGSLFVSGERRVVSRRVLCARSAHAALALSSVNRRRENVEKRNSGSPRWVGSCFLETWLVLSLSAEDRRGAGGRAWLGCCFVKVHTPQPQWVGAREGQTEHPLQLPGAGVPRQVDAAQVLAQGGWLQPRLKG